MFAGKKNLEATSKMYFDELEEHEPYSADLDLAAGNAGRRMNTQELIELEENTKFVARREREINQVVSSIADLNTIFKDLATMVAEQVCVWDFPLHALQVD